jgi:hypothetical protein
VRTDLETAIKCGSTENGLPIANFALFGQNNDVCELLVGCILAQIRHEMCICAFSTHVTLQRMTASLQERLQTSRIIEGIGYHLHQISNERKQLVRTLWSCRNLSNIMSIKDLFMQEKRAGGTRILGLEMAENSSSASSPSTSGSSANTVV